MYFQSPRSCLFVISSFSCMNGRMFSGPVLWAHCILTICYCKDPRMPLLEYIGVASSNGQQFVMLTTNEPNPHQSRCGANRGSSGAVGGRKRAGGNLGWKGEDLACWILSPFLAWPEPFLSSDFHQENSWQGLRKPTGDQTGR